MIVLADFAAREAEGAAGAAERCPETDGWRPEADSVGVGQCYWCISPPEVPAFAGTTC